jgi:regulator of protease activity HflC (stomatin/prohibitin superfamily)
MAQSLLRRLVLNYIEEKGRIEGAPKVTFLEKKISVEGEDMRAGQGWLQWLTLVSAFYLALPPNAYGVVVFPNGTSHNMPGGLHEVPAGLYKIQYVDSHERFDFSSPVSEMTTDGEKLTLKIILRYRVIDPVLALSITRPVETLIEHVETDLAQYIRTHDHGDIADSSDGREYSKLFSFFSERHSRRIPLSQALSITGIELKDFTGDREYVEMRRKARMDERQTKIEKEQAEYLQEFNRLKAQYKADNEKSVAIHTADLEKKATEHRAEVEKMQARHESEKHEILHDVRLREIELDDRSKHLQRRENEFAKAIDAISTTFASGYPMNPNIIKTMTDLVAALKEDVESGAKPTAESKPAEAKPTEGEARAAPPASPTPTDKVEKLTNTLLDLLNPKR